MNTPLPVRPRSPAPRRAQGFTLVELLVVIAIIGVLATVLMPNFNGARKRSWDTAALQCARAIKTGTVAYQARTGTLPSLPNTVFDYGTLGEDAVEACQGVQVHHYDATGLTAASAGNNRVSVIGANSYCFLAWHQRGSMYVAADQCNFATMRLSQVTW